GFSGSGGFSGSWGSRVLRVLRFLGFSGSKGSRVLGVLGFWEFSGSGSSPVLGVLRFWEFSGSGSSPVLGVREFSGSGARTQERRAPEKSRGLRTGEPQNLENPENPEH